MLFLILQILNKRKLYKHFDIQNYMNYDEFMIFFKRRIEPLIALGVLILLIVLAVQLSNGNELREEISKNCGWGEEDYRCFCEKSEALAIEAKMYNLDSDIGEVPYVQMDR